MILYCRSISGNAYCCSKYTSPSNFRTNFPPPRCCSSICCYPVDRKDCAASEKWSWVGKILHILVKSSWLSLILAPWPPVIMWWFFLLASYVITWCWMNGYVDMGGIAEHSNFLLLCLFTYILQVARLVVNWWSQSWGTSSPFPWGGFWVSTFTFYIQDESCAIHIDFFWGNVVISIASMHIELLLSLKIFV